MAALIELAAEPLYILALVNLEFKLRWGFETQIFKQQLEPEALTKC